VIVATVRLIFLVMRFPGNTSSSLILRGVLADQQTSTVWEAKDPDTGTICVLKISKPGFPQVSNELSILSTLSHPAIVPVSEVATPNGAAFAMPFAFGGDLLSWVRTNPIDEDTVKGIVRRILSALAYLHDKHIWHRDIKPDNLLVMDYSLSPECVVLGDFGFARRFPDGICENNFPGSLHYAAPELIEGRPYNESVDIWALGITMFVCLAGRWPFDSGDPEMIRDAIRKGLPELFDGELLDVSDECADLIDWMLEVDPKRRPSAKEAAQHKWLRGMRNRATYDCRIEKEVRFPGLVECA
jgi:serine/threonine protein kinase